jgi:hypothetical protein
MNLLLILASLVSLFHYNHPTVEKIGKEENENIDPKIAKITRSKSIKTHRLHSWWLVRYLSGA